MFTVGQKVYSTFQGWGTVGRVTGDLVYVDTPGSARTVYRFDGSYYTGAPQSLFPGKPIISGYEPPPFEGKLKKGDQVVMRARHGDSFSGIVNVGSDLRDEIVTAFGTVYQKGLYKVYKLVEEQVY